MILKYASVAVVAVGFALGPPAEAGIYADDLARCLVKSASADDNLVLVRWMFGALTQLPALQSMSTVTPEQRVTYDKNMAALYERLTFADCRKEAIEALKYEGVEAISSGFRVLGQVAARDMFTAPSVVQELSGLAKFFDKTKMSALYKEAGVPEPQTPSAVPAK